MTGIETAVLAAATITMGIAAGVYQLYTFAIMPGLRRTDDRTFVGAFQQIDTAIVGPYLVVFFIGPLALSAVAGALLLDADGAGPALIGAAVAMQLIMAAITLRVNVPLNNDIKAAGDPERIDDIAAVRRRFNEERWVRWNNIRALAATVAFGLLVWASILLASA
ncbi:MAG: DUF1772 domain-containing protein [Acidimicrobiia bacterium]|nr:DUF1772 domain-containing protein [Acidimicrobiia bacterium]